MILGDLMLNFFPYRLVEISALIVRQLYIKNRIIKIVWLAVICATVMGPIIPAKEERNHPFIVPNVDFIFPMNDVFKIMQKLGKKAEFQSAWKDFSVPNVIKL
jgi:hypothetical protein